MGILVCCIAHVLADNRAILFQAMESLDPASFAAVLPHIELVARRDGD